MYHATLYGGEFIYKLESGEGSSGNYYVCCVNRV